MSLSIDSATTPALLVLAASVVFLLYAIVRVFLLYKKRGAKPWNRAQLRLGWISAAVGAVVALAFFGAIAYLALNPPIMFWHAALIVAFYAAYTLAMNWYERRLFALADSN